MSPLTDEQLVESLQEGDPQALNELYERYAKRLYAFCRYTLGFADTQEAEDLVHDVFMRLVKAANTFNPELATFRTWLFRIARNLCIDKARRKSRFSFLTFDFKVDQDGGGEQLALERILASPEDGMDDQIQEAELLQEIRDCIQQIQDGEEKQAILLYYFGSRVYREIAEVLGSSLSTAKNRVAAAQQSVKNCLELKGIFSW
jgi:RNA polymerase sigma-70 factor (ECF subfamily)